MAEIVFVRTSLCVHRRRKGLKVGGAEVPVIAAEVDLRCGSVQPPDADESIISCNSKVAPK